MFRFTIRELILLTTVAALGIAWWIDHERLYVQATTPHEVWQHRAEAAADVLRGEGWDVSWRYNVADFGKDGVSRYSFHFLNGDLPLEIQTDP